MNGEPLTLFVVDREGDPRPSRRAPRTRTQLASPVTAYPEPARSEARTRRPRSQPPTELPADPQSVKLLLTPTDAAQALGIGRSKLYELMRAGVVESVLIDTSRRIPTAALERYVQSLLRDAAT